VTHFSSLTEHQQLIFFVHTVEHVLDEAEMTVVVVTTPDPTSDPAPSTEAAGPEEGNEAVRSGASRAAAGAGDPSPDRAPKSLRRGRRG
jgi:hypothetical protein